MPIVEAEIGVIFVVCLVFSFLYEWREGLLAGIFSSISWIVFSLYWLVAANTNVVVFALLWFAVGIIYMVRWMILLLSHLKLKKLGEVDDTEEWEGIS